MEIRPLILFCLLFWASIFRGYGQYAESLNTDRPGQAFTPHTVGKGAFQLEAGPFLAGSRPVDGSYKNTALALAGFFKHGVTETFELNYGLTVFNQAVRMGSDEETSSGVQGMNLGARFNIKSGEGQEPSFGFLFSVFFNNYSHPTFRTADPAPLFLFLYSQSLGDVVSLSGNAGMSWNGDSSVPQGNYVINLGFSLTPALGAFIETYGSVSNSGSFQASFDGGFAYLLSPNLQLDLSGGYGANDQIRDYFVSTGVSIRTARR